MSDEQRDPMTDPARIADVITQMIDLATEGCTGVHDGACCSADLELPPKEWCKRCLMGTAAMALQEMRARLSVLDPPQAQGFPIYRCDLCGDLFDRKADIHAHVEGRMKFTEYRAVPLPALPSSPQEPT